MGNDHNTAALQCKLLLIDMLRDVRAYLLAQSPYESLAEQVHGVTVCAASTWQHAGLSTTLAAADAFCTFSTILAEPQMET